MIPKIEKFRKTLNNNIIVFKNYIATNLFTTVKS
jgi:hypothetical protein